MRELNRNKRELWYANLISSEPVKDEWGNETGESDDTFSDPPVKLYLNVSAATGQAAAEAFGAFTDYSRVISTCDLACPLQIGSRVWFDTQPPKSHNYVVVRKADSLNSLLIALKEVTVS